MSVVLLILGLVLFVGLVVAHEFGHFIVALLNGVEVEEFGIGFPPRVWSRKTKRGLLFSVNWLPLGGFVRLKGEHDVDTEPGTFGAASTWVKTKIAAAGVGMNLLVALILFTILALVGMPQLIDNQFTVKSDTKIARISVQDGSPASKAGLQPNDQLLEIASATNIVRKVSGAADLSNITKQLAGQNVTITYIRRGQVHRTTTQLLSTKEVQASLKTDSRKGYLGVSPTLQRSTWSAPIVALGIVKQFTVLTFEGLWTAITSLLSGNVAKASGQVSGPVGIFVLLKDGSLLGYQFTLMIVAIISLSLAIFNVLPIPALDGGRIFVIYVSRLFNKRISQNVEDWVYGVSFILLLSLVALITIVDIKRFF